jgi:hypothetical protein
MLRRILKFSPVFLWIAIAACGTTGVKSLEPGQRVELPGISIRVPQEDGWVYTHDVRGNDHFVSLFRRGGSPTYTFVTNVQVAQVPPEALADGMPDPEEFLSGIEGNCRANVAGPRFEVVADSHRLEPRFADLCVCSESTANDTEAANKGDADHLVLKAKAYNFLIEPQDQSPPLVVHIGYTERGKEQEIGPDFDLRAERFFAAVDVTR